MDPDRWRRIQELFDAALSREPTRRLEWLDECCADDPALRDEVASLLEALSEDRIPGIVAGATDALDPGAEPMVGRRFGPYRVVRELGRGGMGAVWLAERDDGQFEQRVAIKFVRDPFPSARLLERFQEERRILARLEHPNVARLLDGGTTDSGMPYVVMEYVDGEPIDADCDRRELPARERLELFCQVCDAVQHAHRALIVHRDLKPSNVLVTREGVPKLLDFGIAKLVQPEDGPQQETRTADRVLTPDYASPEQIQGLEVTTASDVYSLGVVLYRLLTGQAPYRVESTAPGFTEAVCTQDPERPSIAVLRSTGNRRSSRKLGGDLDNIVLKALRKEPARRYGTVAALAEDLRRHLDGLPVAARPDTWGYRTTKFVRRNRGLVAAVALVAIVLVAGAATSTVLALRAARQREEARRQTAIARAVNEFLNVDVLAQADPYNESNRDITLKEVVDLASERVGDRFAGEPLVEAAVRGTLGKTYENLGDYTTAETHYLRARELLESDANTEFEALAECLSNLSGIYYLEGRYVEALEVLHESRALERDRLPRDHPTALVTSNTLALVYDGLGRIEESIAAMEESVAIHRRVLGDEHPETLIAINNLALTYGDLDRFDEAGPLLKEVLDTRRRTLGNDNPDTVLSLSSLGFHFTLTGEPERAEALLREAVETGRRVLGPDHPWQTNNLSLLGSVYLDAGHLADALRVYGEAVERQLRSLGADHVLTQRSQIGLARTYSALERHEEALALVAEVVECRLEALGDEHPRTIAAKELQAQLEERR